MHSAAQRVVRNELASELQVASATTEATQSVRNAVSRAVKEAAQQAVRGVVTSDVAAMARAAVDHAISISYGMFCAAKRDRQNKREIYTSARVFVVPSVILMLIL